MGKPTGFMEIDRELPDKRPVAERVLDNREIYRPFAPEKLRSQAARCMDCGVPTCMAGCPLGNRIPEWNHLVYRGHWREAFEQLQATNNFPEFTGRLCPAPCEEACVLAINDRPVTIEVIEKEIAEHAFDRGWVLPQPPAQRTGRRVAVVGSGPAGLACAQQLNRAGHRITLFERNERLGGLLRYGIPDFKMGKSVVDRRIALLEAEGIRFATGVTAGRDISADQLMEFDATVICTGALRPRDLPLPGRELDGIHFAMDFLSAQNRTIAGEGEADGFAAALSARNKHVVVIGGGDTGSDCVGVCNRQGALSVTNFQYTAPPPPGRPDHQPWPYWPMRLRTSSSHEEGCDRQWGLLTTRFCGSRNRVEKLVTTQVAFRTDELGRSKMIAVPGSEREWPADLVLLAIGYSGPETGDIVGTCDLALDRRGNIRTGNDYMTSRTGVFSAGDCRRGQSLIVWAVSEGREAAREVDLFLMGESVLPSKGCCDLPRV